MFAAVLGLLPGIVFAQQDLERAAEEFQVQTRLLGMRSDSPRKGPGRASAIGQFHGRLFENFRNDFLDAVPHEQKQRDADKNLLRRHQFGFNASGPVVIPRVYNGSRTTFFSVSFEGVRERIARSYLRTVPIVPERTGDYSDVVDYSGNRLPIYDPASTRLNPNFDASQPVAEENLQYLRDPFPGNRMPSNRLDPVSVNMMTYYPVPNSDAGPFFRNNYFVVAPETNRANGMIFKVDHSFRERSRISGGGSFTNGFAGSARFIPNASDSAVPDRNYQNRRFSLEHVYTASPQSVNTLSFEASTDRSENVSDSGGYPEQLGLKGIEGDQFPMVWLGAYLNMGRQSPSARNVRNSFVFTDAHSLKRGRHNLRFVGQWARNQVNTYNPIHPSGSFRFTSGLTSLPGIVNTGHAFASFLLGGVESGDVSLVPSPSYFRNSRGLTAVQDTWEIRQGLTVSFGASVEIGTPRTEKYDRQTTVDLNAIDPLTGRLGALVTAGRQGQGRSFQQTRARLEPNFSVSWNPRGSKKDIVRLSHARSYQSIPIYNGQWGTQGFNGYETFFSPNAQLEPAFSLFQGVPRSRALPDLRPQAANDTDAALVHRGNLLPCYQSISTSYERELPASLIVTLGAGLAWGRDLLLSNGGANPNAIPVETLSLRDRLNDIQFSRSLSPYPQYLGFDVYSAWPAGRYRREAVYTRIEKRLSKGLSLNAYYEYSRQMDDYSGPYGVQDYYNRRAEWSLTAYNNPHRISLTYQYELPIGTNKPFFAYSDWRRILTNGWAVSGITSVTSGEPIALRPQFNNTGGVVQALRVNLVPGVEPTVPDQGPELWFNPEAFSHPDDFSLGDAPRTHPALRNPTSQNHDLSLTKRFAIDAERTMELSASGFNFLNRGNWNDPDVIIGTASAPNVNTGRIIGSRGGRVIQLGLRFSF